MGMFKGSIQRSNTDEVRIEDSYIKEFFDKQEYVISYESKLIDNDWHVYVNGDVHIYPKDIFGGTLPFKLDSVSGNLVIHPVISISPELIPEHLGGKIIFDTEGTESNNTTGSSQEQVDDEGQTLSPGVSHPEQDDVFGQLNFNIVPPRPETIRKGILSYLVDADKEMTMEELQIILTESKKQRNRTYELDIDFKKELGCLKPEFAIVDNEGKKYPFKLETKHAAVYLTFLSIDDDICLEDFCDSRQQTFFNCEKIYRWYLYNGKKQDGMKSISWENIDNKAEREKKKKAAIKTLTEYISKIRREIVEAVPNDKVARQFVIYESLQHKSIFSVPGTTDAIRDKIRNTFRLS